MSNKCPNCVAELVFEPAKNAFVCNYCGSVFEPEQIEIPYHVSTEEPVPLSEVYGEDNPEFIDMNVYTCNNCGASIVINGTESSTYCISCGCPSIVFSRIRKAKRPDTIVPFTITKEQAVSLIRKRVSRGFFIPSEIKKFKVDMVRGIYIPFFVYNMDINACSIVSHYGVPMAESGKLVKYTAKVNNIQLDASELLENPIGYRITPFDSSKMVPFNESYLSGFYSDIPDTSFDKSTRLAVYTAHYTAAETVLNIIKKRDGGYKSIAQPSVAKVTPSQKPITAMFPAWFITFRYKNVPHTVLVNGQTGKVFGPLPMDKGKIIGMILLIGSVSSVIMSIFYSILSLFINIHPVLTGLAVVFLASVISYVCFWFLNDSVKMTQSKNSLKYSKNRQG